MQSNVMCLLYILALALLTVKLLWVRGQNWTVFVAEARSSVTDEAGYIIATY